MGVLRHRTLSYAAIQLLSIIPPAANSADATADVGSDSQCHPTHHCSARCRAFHKTCSPTRRWCVFLCFDVSGISFIRIDFEPPVPLLRPVCQRKLNCARPLIICAEPNMVMVLNHAQPRIDAYEMKHHSFVAPSEIVLEYSPLTPVPAHPPPFPPPPPSCQLLCEN